MLLKQESGGQLQIIWILFYFSSTFESKTLKSFNDYHVLGSSIYKSILESNIISIPTDPKLKSVHGKICQSNQNWLSLGQQWIAVPFKIWLLQSSVEK